MPAVHSIRRSAQPVALFFALVASMTAVAALADDTAWALLALVAFAASAWLLARWALRADRAAEEREQVQALYGGEFNSSAEAWSEFERAFWSHVGKADQR